MLGRLALALAGLGVASAQNLSVGIAVGGAPTNAFETVTNAGHDFHSQSADYLIGATLEYRLPRGFSIEGDGFFRELHLTDTFFTHASHTPVVTWEFPVLAKYRFQTRKFGPFVESGLELRTAGNLNNTNPSHIGFAAGAGLEHKWRRFQFAPAIRYIRWARDDDSPDPETKPDQLELLLGIGGRLQMLGQTRARRFSLGAIAGMTLTHDQPDATASVVTGNPFPPSPGVPPATETGIQYDSGAVGFLAGPAVEIELIQRLSVESDAVYHPIRYASRVVLDNGTSLSSSGTVVSTWEFPVVAKVKLESGRFRPFAEAGPSFRLPVEHISAAGFTAGGGIEIRWRMLKIAPTIRYTRWKDALFPYWTIDERLRSNQVEFLTTFLL